MAEKLFTDIKVAISVAKNKRNTFGGFNYRSLEDIFEAVKPLLVEYNYNLNVSDELCEIGDIPFIKATSILMDEEGNEEMSVGFAAIDINKKSMDYAQATGAASSYARKYSLNALLLLDDTKDNDSDEHYKMTGRATREAAPKAVPASKRAELTKQQTETFRKTLEDTPAMADWAGKNHNVFVADGQFMNEGTKEIEDCFYALFSMHKIDINGNYRPTTK